MTSPLDPDQPGQGIVALMVTRRCNMTCAHCSVGSGPDVGHDEPSEAELLDWVRQIAATDVRAIRFTGGEPMLRPDVICALSTEAKRLGVATAMTTNGFWGYSPTRARRQMRELRRAGLGSLTVSVDSYHAEFQGPAPALNLAAAADALLMPFNFNVVKGDGGTELTQIAQRLEPARGSRLRVYDLQRVGRAQALPEDVVAADAGGFCTSCSYPALTDDGRLIACTGPSYFESSESPLIVGSMRTEMFVDLLERYRQDPILNVIRTRGPEGLRDELQQTPGGSAFPFRAKYFGICDLCQHITRDRSAVIALRERLAQPAAMAEEAARWQVISGNRRVGALTSAYVNGVGACRIFLRAASSPHGARFDADAGHVLGHAHLDWRKLSDYLGGSGLARPLLPALDDPELTRWAPAFFREELSRRALRDGLRAAVQQEALGRIADVLHSIGGDGVLLKGAARLAMATGRTESRSTSDIDIWVDPRLATQLRERLLASGFDGKAGGRFSTSHHLEPIAWQGVPVEIHTRLMAASWGLPDQALLADARPIAGVEPLKTLSPEGFLLHALVHLSASFFSFGLKTAWDLQTIVGESDVDWTRLATLADALRAPGAFWAPMRVLATGLSLPVPADLLRRGPTGRSAERLDAVVRSRVFRSTEGLFDLDVLTKTGLILLVHDGVLGRARYLASQATWRVLRPGTWRAAAARARRTDVLRQSWRQYQRYRRATAPLRAAELPD